MNILINIYKEPIGLPSYNYNIQNRLAYYLLCTNIEIIS
jgi:hypothetical protein